MPRHVIPYLRRQQVVADVIEHSAIIVTDIVGYTRIASDINDPDSTLRMLQRLYVAFDDAAVENLVHPLDIIADSWIGVAGAEPGVTEREAAERAATLALQLVQLVPPGLRIRVGVHIGPVVAGVLGIRKPKWTLIGDTVNVAARMESTGQPMRIQVTQELRAALMGTDKVDNAGAAEDEANKSRRESYETPDTDEVNEPQQFRFIARDDPVQVKGKGLMSTFWLEEAPAFGVGSLSSRLSTATARAVEADAVRREVADALPVSPQKVGFDLESTASVRRSRPLS